MSRVRQVRDATAAGRLHEAFTGTAVFTPASRLLSCHGDTDAETHVTSNATGGGDTKPCRPTTDDLRPTTDDICKTDLRLAVYTCIDLAPYKMYKREYNYRTRIESKNESRFDSGWITDAGESGTK